MNEAAESEDYDKAAELAEEINSLTEELQSVSSAGEITDIF